MELDERYQGPTFSYEDWREVNMSITYGAYPPIKVGYKRVAPDLVESDLGTTLTGDPSDMDELMRKFG